MAPELSEMKCDICEEITNKDELDRYDGSCFNCHKALEDAGDILEKQAGSGEAVEEASPELLKAVAAALRRREYMREYNSRPDVKAARKQYMKGRAEREKMLLKQAREKGML